VKRPEVPGSVAVGMIILPTAGPRRGAGPSIRMDRPDEPEGPFRQLFAHFEYI